MKQSTVTGHAHSPSQAPRQELHLALTIVWMALGLLLPRAHVYGGLSPFGVSLCAAVPGMGAAAAYITTLIGYLLPDAAVSPLRYMAALVAVAGIRWSLNAFKSVSNHPLFAPLVTFLSLECTGFALNWSRGIDATDALLIVAEGLLAAGAAYFFSTTVQLCTAGVQRPSTLTRQNMLTAQEQAAVVITAAVTLMAVAAFNFQGISPGRCAASVAVLLLARCGKEQSGSIAGIVMGLTMAMTGSDQLHLAAAFAFGGLIAGIFARFGRFATAAAYIVAHVIVAANAGATTASIAGLYEAVAAGLIFVALPPAVDRTVNRFFLQARDIPAVEGLRRSVVLRLETAAQAVDDVAHTVDAVSHKLADISAPDLGSLMRGLSDTACHSCASRMQCWEAQHNDTMALLNSLTPTLRDKGRLDRNDLPAGLTRRCGRPEALLGHINQQYREFQVRESAFRRLAEIRSMVTDQFASTSALLEELSQDFARSERVDAEAAARVITVCEEYGLAVQDAACLLGCDGRMTVEIAAQDSGVRLPRETWLSAISDACGRTLGDPTVTRYADGIRILLSERPTYAVSFGSAQLRCPGETLCGDAFETFEDGSGRWSVVLSDGMGNGGRAAVDGAMAAGLTASLLQAGLGADSVLPLVNAALMVKSSDESLATLDVAQIDQFTGRLGCRKAGASPTLLLSKGRVSRLERTSLPLGILREITSEYLEDTLTDGDVVLLCSDGALTGGLDDVEDALRTFDPDGETLDQLAQRIAAAARKRQGDHPDDITVLALQLKTA